MYMYMYLCITYVYVMMMMIMPGRDDDKNLVVLFSVLYVPKARTQIQMRVLNDVNKKKKE